MVDEADNPTKADADSSPTPVASREPAPPYDRTIKLDRAIAERDLSVPERFGRYEVIGRIGIGGFASVFSARDPELDAPVAIKVLAENHSADVEVRKRFVAEARVARRLGSDRLIGVFDLGETDDGRPYVVMELASGGTLRARLTRTGRPGRQALLRLIDELGACMIAIHAKDVVHRDIKPSNLLIRTVGTEANEHPTELLEDDERLVLADFGLARDISDGASAVTVGGGTAGYMAPEQADPNGRADFRADIYAATVVLAELTTGRHPERLDLGTAELAPAIREALEEGLSIDRERRPPSAVAWRDRLLEAYRADASTRQLDPDAGPSQQSATTAMIEATQVQAPYPYDGGGDYDLSDVDLPLDAGNAGASTQDTADLDPTEIFDAESVSEPTPRPAAARSSTEGPPPPPPSIPLSPKVQPPRPDAAPRPPTLPDRPVGGQAGPPSAQPGTSAPQAAQVHAPGPHPATTPASAPHLAQPHTSAPQPASAPHPAQPHTSAPQPASAQQPAAPPTPGPHSAALPLSAPPTSGQHPASSEAPFPQARDIVGGTGLAQPQPAVPQHAVPLPVEQQPPPPISAQQGAPQQQARLPRQPAPPGPRLGSTAARANVTIPDPAGPPLGPRYQQPRQQPVPRRHAPQVGVPPSRQAIKQEEKAARKSARRRRRRRRRRRISNLFRALIRGVLAAMVTFIVGAWVATSSTGQSYENLPEQASGLLSLAVFAAFVLGLQLFPWPRRLDPDG